MERNSQLWNMRSKQSQWRSVSLISERVNLLTLRFHNFMEIVPLHESTCLFYAETHASFFMYSIDFTFQKQEQQKTIIKILKLFKSIVIKIHINSYTIFLQGALLFASRATPSRPEPRSPALLRGQIASRISQLQSLASEYVCKKNHTQKTKSHIGIPFITMIIKV